MEILTDSVHKVAYATDASVYREIPYGVAYPKDEEDMRWLLSEARRRGTSIIARAGGTSIAGQASGAILGIKDMIPTDMRVLFSLEEKKRRDEYPADWILLQEPIEDIHSLIYYAAGCAKKQDALRRHIDDEFIDINAYMLDLVQNCQK